MRWLICLLIFFANPAAPAAAEPPLTLDEAVERAVQAAPDVSARSEDVVAMQSLATAAGRLPDPRLLLGIENFPVEGPDAWSTTSDFMTMRKVGVMQEFPAHEKRRLARERADAEAGIAAAELQAAKVLVAREAARAWIRCAVAESSWRELADLQPDFRLGAEAARAAVASGRASTADAFAAETAAARVANRILDLQAEARMARADLARWIGDDAGRPLGPMPDLDRLATPASVLLAEAGRHAELLALDAKLAAARAEVELARAGRRPDWSAELAYAKRGPEFSDMATLQFTVGLPLFAKNRQNPVIAARGAELRRVEAERESGIRMHEAELRAAVIEWEQSGLQLARYDRELLPLARERSRAALAGYRAGSGDLRGALEAFEDEIELMIERAAREGRRASAWAYLAYVEPLAAGPRQEERP